MYPAFGPVATLLISATAYHQKAKSKRIPFRDRDLCHNSKNTYFFQLKLLPRSDINFGPVLCESRCYHLPYTRSSTSDENLRLKGTKKDGSNSFSNFIRVTYQSCLRHWRGSSAGDLETQSFRLHSDAFLSHPHHLTFYNEFDFACESEMVVEELGDSRVLDLLFW